MEDEYTPYEIESPEFKAYLEKLGSHHLFFPGDKIRTTATGLNDSEACGKYNCQQIFYESEYATVVKLLGRSTVRDANSVTYIVKDDHENYGCIRSYGMKLINSNTQLRDVEWEIRKEIGLDII